MVLKCTLLTCLILLFIRIQSCNAGEFEERALGWLDSKLHFSGNHFDFNKVKFESSAFQSKTYGLTYARNIADTISLQANFDLNKSKVRHGPLVHRASSSEFELASWWDADSYRIGFSQHFVLDNKVNLPNTQEIALPSKKTLGVHMQLPVLNDENLITISLQQTNWDMSSTLWSRQSNLMDNQVKLNYSFTF